MTRPADIRSRFPQASADFLARNPQLSTTAKTTPVKSKTTTTENVTSGCGDPKCNLCFPHDPHDVTGGQAADAWDARFFAGIEIPVAEYRFHKTRKWRFDYAWPAYKVALEIEGGVYTRGRHTRPSGFLGDMEKYNAAAVAGWTVIRCTPDGFTTATTLAMLQEVLP